MNSETVVKQVIVMRHDLKMRRGKQIAQGAHASMSFLCRRLQEGHSVSVNDFSETQQAWLTGSFAKVCCRANSDEELLEIRDQSPRRWTGSSPHHRQRQDRIPRSAHQHLLGNRSRPCRED